VISVRGEITLASFYRYIGIDYSGAETPSSSLQRLRVYLATGTAPPEEVLPPRSARKYWTRKGVAEWLLERLAENLPTLVGVYHGFSFPLAYFEKYGLLLDWPGFLDDFQRHWPTDGEQTYVSFLRDGVDGQHKERAGDIGWRRLTEEWAGGAKSVFHFDVQGSVAHSTHAGLPWLRYIRQRLGARVHFWPFDGWDVPVGHSAIAEVYPALWSHDFVNESRTSDQHDAFSIAAWLSLADRDGRLAALLEPDLSPSDRAQARIEGWILGVTNASRGKSRRRRATRGRSGNHPSARTADGSTAKVCPECGRGFNYGTWGGIDAHWKATHENIMPYKRAWPIIKAGGKPSRGVIWMTPSANLLRFFPWCAPDRA
jgi:hypothetical protein